MKKLLLFIIGIVLFIGMPIVKADTGISYTWNNAFTNTVNIDTMYSTYISNTSIIDNLIDYYNDNLSSSYNYYYITGGSIANGTISLCLSFTNDNIIKGFFYGSAYRWAIHYDGSYCYNEYPDHSYSLVYDSSESYYNSVNSFDFGIYFILTSDNFVYSSDDYHNNSSYTSYEELIFPSYSSNNFNISSFSVFDNHIIPTIVSLHDGTYDSSVVLGYREIDLNDYAYVALSLKDYTQTQAFSTNIYTKGQLCLTPVYNYGMTEKENVTDRCTPYYNDFTPVRTTILKQDLDNNAIYYAKAYDTTKENKIKVDVSVFDITYITSENANNPSVIINGRSYPTIPYDDLDNTVTDNEENNYIPGESANVIDYINSTDLFSNPLKILKGVWGAIVSFLALITTFIALLPPTMQAFLYMAFSIAIILGIIKIIL